MIDCPMSESRLRCLPPAALLRAALLLAALLPATAAHSAPTPAGRPAPVSPWQASGVPAPGGEPRYAPESGTSGVSLPTTRFGWPLAWHLGHPRLRITNYPDDDRTTSMIDYMAGTFTYEGHQGTDININSFQDMDEGVPVLAAANGRVVYTQDDQFDREITAPPLPWNVVVLLHEDGTESIYGHLRRNSVTVQYGEYVREGQMIGMVGSAGFTLMPHLHFEVAHLSCASDGCAFDGWVDPWHGIHNTAPSLWKSQEDYVGDDHLRVHDLGITTLAAFNDAGGPQNLAAFKERPSQPAVVGINELNLTAWVLVSGQPVTDTYEIRIHRPDGTIFGQTQLAVGPIDRAWGQGWHGLSFRLLGNASPSDYGEWNAEVTSNGVQMKVDPFTVGPSTVYAPRFWPKAGKSFHLSNSRQADTLSVSSLGAPASSLTFALENAPSNVSLATDATGRTLLLIESAGLDLAGVRSREFAVVASDPSGLQARMHYHLVNYAASTLGSPPIVTAPPTASAFEGDTITVDVSASDPDGDAIASLTADLGTLPAGNTATFTTGADNTSGRLTWPTRIGDGGVRSVQFRATTSLGGGTAAALFGFRPIEQTGAAATTITVRTGLPARAFTSGGDRTLRLFSDKPTWCVGVEPVDGSFRVSDIEPSSVALYSSGSGVVSKVSPPLGKASVIGDRDRNSIEDLTICFTKEDLRALFSRVTGKRTFGVILAGRLISGARFSTRFDVNVLGVPETEDAAGVSPNPLNPEGVLTLQISRPGPVRVQIYDTQGRLVRTILDTSHAGAGTLQVRVDSRTGEGSSLGSGVYFLRISTGGGVTTSRFVVLK